MSRLILHIGTHKTATTSIQKYLNRNRDVLAERGIFYPSYDLIDHPVHYAHQAAVNAFSNQNDDMTRDQAIAFFAAVRARRADHDITILSAEPLYRHLDQAPAQPMPQDPEVYWARRRSYITQIAEQVGGAEVVVVFREQADYAHSLYQEHVKSTRYHHNMQVFRQRFWFHFDFLGQAKAWDAVFPGLRALSYAHLCRGAGVEENFAAALDLNLPEGLPTAGRQNEGMLPDLVVLKRLLHHTCHSRDDIRRRMDQLDHAIRQHPDLLGMLRARTLYRDAKGRRAFHSRFAAANAELTQTYITNVPEGEEAFPLRPLPNDIKWGEVMHPDLADFLTRRVLDAA
ncbi:hypothetical protein JANAI62_18780 [Jannaschia pagri]|uniref:Sulfotransferase family protein n=1 Tax=Jannaschia pagri TaxID=2829797 RepID=A0ABQ4NLG6_9RHOB|nr:MULTISPECIES: hypothetical protein [unclassified Jannaschia]GIT91421.1 hypothetical protein JANAI61_18790 [Jannaschia sp. AI_61]GIT95255.1 hypothetical protein JANAI62_18780 [Jannaschia sp. AI_62]